MPGAGAGIVQFVLGRPAGWASAVQWSMGEQRTHARWRALPIARQAHLPAGQ